MNEKPIPEELGKTIKKLKKRLSEQKNTEERLLGLKQRYEVLYDLLLDSVYIHDIEGNFITANQASLNMLGYTKGEIPSINFTSLIDESHLPLAFKALEKVLRNPSQQKPTEFKLKKKNGEKIWVETRASLLYKNGEAYAVQGVARDITKRKRAEKRLIMVKQQNKKVSQAKDLFLSKLFKKLPSTLTQICSLTTDDIINVGKVSEEKIKTHFKMINEYSSNMLRFLNDNIHLSNPELDKME